MGHTGNLNTSNLFETVTGNELGAIQICQHLWISLFYSIASMLWEMEGGFHLTTESETKFLSFPFPS